MESDPQHEDEAGRGGYWVFIFWGSLLFLSIFWSVDSSFVYFILAVTAFSFFKILQSRSNSSVAHAQQARYEQEYKHQSTNTSPSFWEQLKNSFQRSSSQANPAQRGKIFVALVAGFIGFMFLIAILGAIFGGDGSGDLSNYYIANNYYNNRQYDSAAYFYKLAIADNPENPEMYFECGNAFFNTNKTDSALIMYNETLARNPQHDQAQYYKGAIYYNRKNYGQAIDESKKVLEYRPDYTDAMLLIGDSFYNQSQLDSALQWYEKAYSNGVRSAILSHYMAYIYDVKGKRNQAIDFYKEAIQQDSTIKSIYVRLGELVPGENGNWYRAKAAQMQ